MSRDLHEKPLPAGEEIRVIELYMMNPKLYYPLTVTSSFIMRGFLYPLNLIKTRLQVQTGKHVYKGTFDALCKIPKHEGLSGLYRGFWFHSLTFIPSMCYITTYENMRTYLNKHTSVTDSTSRAFISGGMASIVGQTLAVPIDIITQHMQLLGGRQVSIDSSKETTKLRTLQELHIPEEISHKRFGAVYSVIQQVHKQAGFLGFYKGYFVSLAVFTPNSALWWMFYDFYTDTLFEYSPAWVPRLPMQFVVAAPLSGCSAAMITNPVDLVRCRMQVRGDSFKMTCTKLWQEEHLRLLYKGLSVRLIQSSLFSFFLMFGYETIKRWSLLDEYKDSVRW